MIISVSNHADRIRLIAIETMEGAFGNEGALLFCDKNMSVEAMALPILKRDSVSRFGASPTRLRFASVTHTRVELIKLLCFERELVLAA